MTFELRPKEGYRGILEFTCPNCGEVKSGVDNILKRRLKKCKCKMLFCSSQCYHTFMINLAREAHSKTKAGKL